MKKCFLVLTVLFFSTTYAAQADPAWQMSPYFNTQFLSNYDLVESTLIKQSGFEPVSFESTDGIKLSGLFLKRPKARGTILFCAGFCPGRKEGQAPVYRMLPPDYNVLFFDARGHAKSKGKFFRSMHRYGRDEYKDVLGALAFVQEKSPAPIVLYGICAGAFHAARTLIELEKKDTPQKYNIVGFIFDSGFGSAKQLSESSALNYHIREKILPKKLGWYASKEKVKNTLLYKASACFLTGFAYAVTETLWLRGVRKLDPETNLFDKIHAIDCPILFIHCKNDNYSPFEDVLQLSESVQNKTCWWLEDSSHALHAIKHKVKYREKLLDFIDSVLLTNEPTA